MLTSNCSIANYIYFVAIKIAAISIGRPLARPTFRITFI